MRNPGLLFLAMSVLAACSTDPAPTLPTQDLAVSPPPPDLASPPDLTPAPIVTQCGGIPVLGPQGKNTTFACLGCIASSCCAEGMACGSDANCLSLQRCLSDCKNGTCTAGCYGTYGLGTTKSDSFADCRDSKCYPSCYDFSCIGSVVWPDPPQATYPMTLFAVDFATQKAIPNVTVKVCPPGDAACANPVAMGTTAANGSVLLSLPAAKSGINGFLELSEPSYVTTLNFVSEADNTRFFTFGSTSITLVSKAAFTQLVGAVGATADPARGHLAFFTKDCSGSRAAGVNVTASNTDAQSTAAYFIGAIPSKTATQTDLSGTGYVANVPTGAVTVTGKYGTMRMGSQTVLVRAGALTTFNVTPTP